MTKYESVLQFHKAFGLDAPDRPTMPSESLSQLRYELTKEENSEKLCAGTLTQYLDAIADLLYVVHGDAVAAGISEEQLDRAFREVHESNMSKMWSAYEIYEAKKCYKDWAVNHQFVDTCPKDPSAYSKIHVVKNKLGKVIKSPSYKPVDLSWIEKGTE